ncbi:serine/arginine repetitive matrix protein 3 isoform X2 [Amia ocellicauda]|uniref:serine/arginine repetitive matrix protein 3 isoform X2 n=1 Tax=Amia ocellicauda TaxID=2972642 RepID=UPI003463D68B
MYDGARVPSPQESANGFPQPGASAARPKSDDETRKTEPLLVKKAHREILDHERKRRVELKCMELQEMMEEQGYSEEEIRQKVGTFRQMLMEKEGVITREDQHGHPMINHGGEEHREDLRLAEGYVEQCDCHGDCYARESVSRADYRMKRKSSSSASPPPKKRKKKKSGRRRSRFDSSSPPRKEKKKKSGKKHKRDRSASGSRKKRRYRSGSPKNKHKDKNKQRKRSPLDSPGRRSYRRGSCCSSHSASLSSAGSLTKSPSRPNSKHRVDRHKSNCTPSSRSGSASPGHVPNPPALWQNGHRDGSKNGRESGTHSLPGEKSQDKIKPTPASPSLQTSVSPESKVHKTLGRSPGRLSATSGDERPQGWRRSRSVSSGKRSSRQRVPVMTARSPAHTGCSSDSGQSQRSLTQKNKSTPLKKVKGPHASQRHRRHRAAGRHRSPSVSSVKQERHGRHSGGRKKSSSRSLCQRSSSWSSSPSPSRSHSRERQSKAKSPHSRQNASREKDSEGRAHHTDTESRTRRRSRSYSPIRKRRRDSPSFMEPRRITRSLEDPGPLLSCRQGYRGNCCRVPRLSSPREPDTSSYKAGLECSPYSPLIPLR